MVGVIVVVLVGALLIAVLSDRRDRHGGHMFRPPGAMAATGRRLRRQGRRRREQINRTVVPPRDVDDGT